MPDATLETMKWFNVLQRMTTSPDNALRLLAASVHIDVRELLPQIRVPTLVMHSRHDAAVSYARGRELAAGIPDARFVTLESSNHLLREDEPGWTRFLEEVRGFLAD